MGTTTYLLLLLLPTLAGAAKSKWISTSNLSFSNGETAYINPIPMGLNAKNADESWVQAILPTAGTIRKLRIHPPSGAGGTYSATFTLRKNGSDTSLSATVTGNSVATNNTDSVAVVAADLISLKVTGGGGSGISGYYGISLEFEATIAGETVLFSSFSTSTLPSGARFLGLGAEMSGGHSATATDVEIVMPLAGTIKKLYVKNGGSPGAGKSRTFHTSINGATSGDLTVVINEPDSSGNDTSNTGSVSAGDRLSIRQFGTNTPASVNYRLGLVLVPTTPGQFVIPFVSTSTLISSIGTSDFAPLTGTRGPLIYLGDIVYSPAHDDFQIVGAQMYLVTAPGTGSSRTTVLRENAGDASTTFTMTISGTNQTASASGTFTPAANSSLATKFSNSNDPAVSKVMISYTGYIEPSSPSTRRKSGDFMPFFY